MFTVFPLERMRVRRGRQNIKLVSQIFLISTSNLKPLQNHFKTLIYAGSFSQE